MDADTGVLDAVEQPVSTETQPESTSQEENSQEVSKESTQQETPEQKADRRTNPDLIRKALKHFRENAADHAPAIAAIERSMGELKSYKAAIPSVREARDMMSAVQSFGGVQKIAEMRESMGRYEEIDRQLEMGDPAFLKEVAEQMPKGLVKLLPSMLEQVAGIDGAAAYNAIEPYALQYLSLNKFPDMVNGLVAAYKTGDNEQIRQAISKMAGWYKEATDNQTKIPSVDPERQEFESEREKFYREQFEGKLSGMFDRTISHAEQEMSKYLRTEQKKYGFSDEAYQILLEESWKALTNARNKDAVFLAALKTHVNEGRKQISEREAESVVNDYTDRRAKEFVDQRVRAIYGGKSIAKPAADVNAKKDPVAPPKGATAQIDYSKTQEKLGSKDAMRAYLLQGKGFDAQGKPLVKKGSTWTYATA